jgi:hypothetical protein
MPNAPRLLIAALVLGAAPGCHKSTSPQNAQTDELALNNTAAAPADIEALPPDESSATPSNQLVNGDDNPDVNDTTANSSD